MLFSRSRGKLLQDQDQERQAVVETVAKWRTIAASTKDDPPKAPKAQTSRDIFLSEAIEVSEEPVLPETETFGKANQASSLEQEKKQAARDPRLDSLPERSARQLSLPPQAPSWTAGAASLEDSQSVSFETGELRERSLNKSKAAPVGDFGVPLEEDLKHRFGTNIRSALGPGTVIDGTFRFENPVCVDGTLTGEVCSSSVLIAGAQATVEASIIVGTLIVVGTVIGDVEADELVEIRAGGQLKGNVETRRIVIEEGGKFNGNVKML